MAALRSVIHFEVSANVPHKTLTEATEAGLQAARQHTRADANGSLGSIEGDTRSVRIDLALPAANAEDAMRAERAFADAFIARIETKGFAAART